MKRVLFFLIIFISGHAVAQQSNTGVWYQYFGANPINKKWTWHNEVQYRNYNAGGDLEQLLLRTGIGYNLSENNNNLLLGYGFIYGKRYANGQEIFSREHRIFQQFITRQRFGRLYLQHRYRIEERILQDDFRVRFRYFLAANIPLNKKEMTKGSVYLSLYNEPFLNLEKPVFDRNRVYGAIGYAFNKDLKFEIGYMGQILENTHREQFQVAFFNSMPFFKSE